MPCYLFYIKRKKSQSQSYKHPPHEIPKFRNTKKGEWKVNATSHSPRIKNPRRDDKKRSAPLSSKAPSTSYLCRSFSERTGEKRKGQPKQKKKVNRDEPGISHHTCNKDARKKKRNKKENKNKRTGLDAGLADVDGNNLSHLFRWWVS
jgi:hypothetical protein